MSIQATLFQELQAIVEELGFTDSQTDIRDVFNIIKALLRGDATIPRGTPDQYSLKQLENECAELAASVQDDKKIAAVYRRLRIPVSVNVNERIVMHVDGESVHLTIRGQNV